MLRSLLLPLVLASLSLRAQDPKIDQLNNVQVYGTVIDGISGKPVYDCLVEYYTNNGERKSVSSVNADGRYAMFIPAGKSFELRVTRENGYLEMRQTVQAVPYGVKQFRKDLFLQPRTAYP